MTRRRLSARSTVVIGEFDGMHLGHQALVSAARTVAARQRQPLVGVVLDDVGALERLSSIEDRLRALLVAGCSSAIAVPVDPSDGSRRSELVADRIVDVTGAASAVLACAPSPPSAPSSPLPPTDVRYPSMRAGFRSRGVDVVEVDRVHDAEGAPIVGWAIRAGVRAGAVEHVGRWLGRPYALRGIVVHGAGLGRTIGFATANVEPPLGRVIPSRGVYAARVTISDGSEHDAAVNIGHRPTVAGDGRLLIEAHLLDFDDDLYETSITIAFRRWLRAEQRFSGIDELVEQLARDVAEVRRG